MEEQEQSWQPSRQLRAALQITIFGLARSERRRAPIPSNVETFLLLALHSIPIPIPIAYTPQTFRQSLLLHDHGLTSTVRYASEESFLCICSIGT